MQHCVRWNGMKVPQKYLYTCFIQKSSYMQLQVLKMSRTPLIFEENVTKIKVFWTILTKLTISWIINEICDNMLIVLYGWTHNAAEIPKMYNIIGIWWIDQKLLIVKHIATLRDMKNDRQGDERYMTKVIYQPRGVDYWYLIIVETTKNWLLPKFICKYLENE